MAALAVASVSVIISLTTLFRFYRWRARLRRELAEVEDDRDNAIALLHANLIVMDHTFNPEDRTWVVQGLAATLRDGRSDQIG